MGAINRMSKKHLGYKQMSHLSQEKHVISGQSVTVQMPMPVVLG